jgi:S-adenosylmethionine decarboxylase
LAAASAAGATVLNSHFHHFGEQQGVTGVLLLMESHISIHTWPEHGYAAIDLFMCGQAQVEAALLVLKEKINSSEQSIQLIARGFSIA